jgi:hypothetical protein
MPALEQTSPEEATLKKCPKNEVEKFTLVGVSKDAAKHSSIDVNTERLIFSLDWQRFS